MARLLGMKKNIEIHNIETKSFTHFKNKELNEISDILYELKLLIKSIHMNENKEENKLKFAALVIDRFCLWAFFIVTFLITIFVFFTSKNFFYFS